MNMRVAHRLGATARPRPLASSPLLLGTSSTPATPACARRPVLAASSAAVALPPAVQTQQQQPGNNNILPMDRAPARLPRTAPAPTTVWPHNNGDSSSLPPNGLVLVVDAPPSAPFFAEEELDEALYQPPARHSRPAKVDANDPMVQLQALLRKAKFGQATDYLRGLRAAATASAGSGGRPRAASSGSSASAFNVCSLVSFRDEVLQKMAPTLEHCQMEEEARAVRAEREAKLAHLRRFVRAPAVVAAPTPSASAPAPPVSGLEAERQGLVRQCAELTRRLDSLEARLKRGNVRVRGCHYAAASSALGMAAAGAATCATAATTRLEAPGEWQSGLVPSTASARLAVIVHAMSRDCEAMELALHEAATGGPLTGLPAVAAPVPVAAPPCSAAQPAVPRAAQQAPAATATPVQEHAGGALSPAAEAARRMVMCGSPLMVDSDVGAGRVAPAAPLSPAAAAMRAMLMGGGPLMAEDDSFVAATA